MPGIDPSRPFVPLSIAVLTVSDSRRLADDKSDAKSSDHRYFLQAQMPRHRPIIAVVVQ
jgi:hypothetical protein